MTEMERFKKWWESEGKDSMHTYDFEAWGAWQAARRWIPVSEAMPGNEVPVLAYGYNEYGKLRRIRAAYVYKHTVEDMDENYCGDLDYDEDTDTGYIPEGWYEWNEYEDTHWMVQFDILGWQPMPEVKE